MGFFDTISKPFARIPESFIGNNKPRKVRKSVSKLEKTGDKKMASKTIQVAKVNTALGKGMSNILAKPTVVKKQKVERATLNQKMCIYAICMKLYNKKEVAKEISNRFGKSRDLASNKIQELLQIQKSREL